MTFDSARARIVLFGGATTDTMGRDSVTSNVYEWDGAQWRGINTTALHPSARGSHGLTYDVARGVTLLFGGGELGGTRLGDTWSWDGRRWLRVATTGPSAREAFAMTYDAARQQVVLFGGTEQDGTQSNQTWLWNGQSWIRASPAIAPSARSYTQACYDPIRQKVVLFGGYDTATRNDTWEWDGQQWTAKFPTSMPPARWGATMLWNPDSQRIVMFGGKPASGFTSDTRIWSYDGTNWTSMTPTVGFAQRYVSAAAFDPISDRVLLLGGLANAVVTDGQTWALQGSTWVAATQLPLPWSARGPMVYDSVRRRLLMLGNPPRVWGSTGWSPLPPCPGGVGACVFDADRDRIVVVPDGLSETWEFNGTTWTNRSVTSPPPRLRALAGYDPIRQVTILHGGSIDNQPLGDTWEWNGTLWRLAAASGPPRIGAAGAFDVAREEFVVFGGLSSEPMISGETWAWDGAAWSLLATTGPSPRYHHSMVYDPIRERILLFGTFGSTSEEDLWEWDGTAWHQLIASGPESRYYASLGFNAATGEMLLFGGYRLNEPSLSDTWTLRPDRAARVISQSSQQRLCRGQTLMLTAQVEPGHPVTYQWRRWVCPTSGTCTEPNLADGPTASGAIIAGATGPVLTITNVGAADQTNYRCFIASECDSALSQQVFVRVCTADFDCSGSVSVQDIFSFLTDWFAQSSTADINGLDGVTVQDIFDYLAAYFPGCP
jgi:hypothetical protein